MGVPMKWQLAGVALLVAAGALLYSESRRGEVETLGGPVAVRAPAEATPAPATPADAPSIGEVTIAGTPWPVAEYRGIGLPSAPLDLRGCFVFPDALPQGPLAPPPRPPEGPGWFDCFDGRRIAADLAAGTARAILAAPAEMQGADRLIAVYPDGTAFQWRQPAE